tara:strand:+ start:146393 stop:147106 length:714 start_codon:yes stop_codon:yes gene_type:complete
MHGDEKSLVTKSTRAISIFAKKADVWKWLIQLGADRCGFYSYSFIENLLGYKTRHQNFIRPEFQEINVGDIVRGSVDEKSSIIPYNFRVLEVQLEKTLILENWGTFLLKEISNQETRLVIRTRENKASNIFSKVFSYIMVALHYLMERRILIGIKMRVESGEGIRFSQASDILWFLGAVLSELLILSFNFIGCGIVQSFIYPVILSLIWLLSVFLFKPLPLYTVGLLFLCTAILVAV